MARESLAVTAADSSLPPTQRLGLLITDQNETDGCVTTWLLIKFEVEFPFPLVGIDANCVKN